jgi:alpha,alpha-trehalose phosphorylase
MDLDDLEHNTRDGLHMASLAGAWLAIVGGLGGMRARDGELTFAPRLPDGLTRLAFNLSYLDRHLRVTVVPASASYTLQAGAPITLRHYGEPLTVTLAAPTVRAIPAAPALERPSQPRGREPDRRRSAGTS